MNGVLKSNIEKRVDNLENAVVELFRIVHDTLPPAYSDQLRDMADTFVKKQETLGGFTANEFHGEDQS